MKALKIIGVLLIVVVLAFGGLIYYGVQNINGIVRVAIEQVGSDLTETQVTLQDVNIEFLKGRGELKNLKIGNPPGFTSDYAFSLGTIALQVNPEATTGELVTIDEILIDGASIIFEEKNITDSNLRTLSDNVSKHTSQGGSSSTNESSGGNQSPMIKVTKFQFSNADIQLVSQEYGDRTINFPTLALSNLGGESGLPPDQLGAAILDEVLDQARDAAKKEVGDRAKAEVREKAKEKLSETVEEKLSDEDKEKLEDVRSLFNR